MRGTAVAAAAVAMIGVLAAPAQAQAADYPTEDFSATGSGGRTSGSLTWYNRSVGLQGSVTDFAGGWGGTTATFDSFVTLSDGRRSYIDTETRTVSSAERSFNFTVDPLTADIPTDRAITWVYVQVCSGAGSACGEGKWYER